MKRSSVITFLIGLTLGLVLAALVAFNALLFWVATGPRSLQRFTPYIEKALSGESDIQVKIGQTWLIWDGWQQPIDLQLTDVSLLTPEGKVFSSFPEISVGVDILSLPFGKFLPTSLTVESPIISLKQQADKSISFGTHEKGQVDDISSTGDTLAVLVESLVNPHAGSSLRKLRSIELLNADISVGNETAGVIVTAPGSNLVIRKRSDEDINLAINTTLYYGERQTALNANLSYNKVKKRVEGKANVGRLYVAEIAGLLVNDPALSALQFPVSGAVGFAVRTDGTLEAMRFDIDGGRGRIVHERLDGALDVGHAKLVGRVASDFSQVVLERAEAELAGSPFSGAATISRTEQGIGITGQAALSDVPTDQARKFWPLGLAPLSREWVTTNIHDGGITRASVTFNIKPGDLEKPALPKEAIDARINLKDARISYLEGHPEVRSVNAIIKVDGQALDAEVSHASAFSGTALSAGRVYIADLVPDNPLIEVSMHADMPASDGVTLLGLPMLEHAKHLNLDAKKASGRAVGEAKLGFYFFSKDENGKELPITFDVQAKLDNVSMPGFLGRFDIAAATGDMRANDKAIEFTGNANVNGSAITGSRFRYAYQAENGIDTSISGNATINEEILKRFGVTLPIPVPETLDAAVEADLFTQGDAVSFERFSVKGEKVSLTGSAKLTPDGKDLSSITIQNLKYGKNILSQLEYGIIEGGMRLRVKGESFDAAPFLEKDKDGSGFSFEHFPAVDASFEVGTAYALGGKQFGRLRGTMLCSVKKCSAADLSADIDGKKLSFKIGAEGKNRRLNVAAENAGAALKALGIIDTMEGGVLSVTGQYQDMAGGALKGMLSINDYTMVNAPVLAKLLTLTSLTSFFDTLSGKGIGFAKLKAPFVLSDDVITLKDAKTYGSAMGLTADGTVTFPKTLLKLEGTIVPSYTLNNVLGNVPVIGTILTGGGEGVFAAKYTMKGDADNPDVMVNPLSILTPGFLRNMFDVF